MEAESSRTRRWKRPKRQTDNLGNSRNALSERCVAMLAKRGADERRSDKKVIGGRCRSDKSTDRHR